VIAYLALGDSYTIGTGASDDSKAWPSIIARRLEHKTGDRVELTNPAVNGFTTDDLIVHELPHVARLKPDLVTVLIGVNDLVRGRSPDHYRAQLIRIYGEVAALRLQSGRALAVSIPDWSFVPAVSDFGGARHVKELTGLFNVVAQEEAAAHGLPWVDLGAASRSRIGSPGWIASDDLHPGDEQYAAWAEVIWTAVAEAF
jgi:acyl-CoA thioesterase I